MTDYNSFLRIPFYVYYSINMYMRFILLKLFHAYFDRIRDLFIIIQEYLFSNDFTHKESRRFVCQLFCSEVWRRIRQQFLYPFEEHIDAKLILCRNRQYLGIGYQIMPILYNIAKFVLIALVYFINQQQYRDRHFLHLFQKIHIFLWAFNNIRDIKQDVGIL